MPVQMPGRPREKRNARFFIIVNRALKESTEIVDNTTLSASDPFWKITAGVIRKISFYLPLLNSSLSGKRRLVFRTASFLTPLE